MLKIETYDVLVIDTINLKIDGAVLEILIKTYLVQKVFSLISREWLH